jgi:hypothetical protein
LKTPSQAEKRAKREKKHKKDKKKDKKDKRKKDKKRDKKDKKRDKKDKSEKQQMKEPKPKVVKEKKERKPKMELPEGWRVEQKIRKNGNTAGTSDKYFVSPEGKRCRSMAEVARYISGGGKQADIEKKAGRQSLDRERKATREKREREKKAKELEQKEQEEREREAESNLPHPDDPDPLAVVTPQLPEEAGLEKLELWQDPRFGICCSFLSMFGPALGIDTSMDQLEEAILTPRSSCCKSLHLLLLKKLGHREEKPKKPKKKPKKYVDDDEDYSGEEEEEQQQVDEHWGWQRTLSKLVTQVRYERCGWGWTAFDEVDKALAATDYFALAPHHRVRLLELLMVMLLDTDKAHDEFDGGMRPNHLKQNLAEHLKGSVQRQLEGNKAQQLQKDQRRKGLVMGPTSTSPDAAGAAEAADAAAEDECEGGNTATGLYGLRYDEVGRDSKGSSFFFVEDAYSCFRLWRLQQSASTSDSTPPAAEIAPVAGGDSPSAANTSSVASATAFTAAGGNAASVVLKTESNVKSEGHGIITDQTVHSTPVDSAAAGSAAAGSAAAGSTPASPPTIKTEGPSPSLQTTSAYATVEPSDRAPEWLSPRKKPLSLEDDTDATGPTDEDKQAMDNLNYDVGDPPGVWQTVAVDVDGVEALAEQLSGFKSPCERRLWAALVGEILPGLRDRVARKEKEEERRQQKEQKKMREQQRLLQQGMYNSGELGAEWGGVEDGGGRRASRRASKKVDYTYAEFDSSIDKSMGGGRGRSGRGGGRVFYGEGDDDGDYEDEGGGESRRRSSRTAAGTDAYNATSHGSRADRYASRQGGGINYAEDDSDDDEGRDYENEDAGGGAVEENNAMDAEAEGGASPEAARPASAASSMSPGTDAAAPGATAAANSDSESDVAPGSGPGDSSGSDSSASGDDSD